MLRVQNLGCQFQLEPEKEIQAEELNIYEIVLKFRDPKSKSVHEKIFKKRSCFVTDIRSQWLSDSLKVGNEDSISLKIITKQGIEVSQEKYFQDKDLNKKQDAIDFPVAAEMSGEIQQFSIYSIQTLEDREQNEKNSFEGYIFLQGQPNYLSSEERRDQDKQQETLLQTIICEEANIGVRNDFLNSIQDTQIKSITQVEDMKKLAPLQRIQQIIDQCMNIEDIQNLDDLFLGFKEIEKLSQDQKKAKICKIVAFFQFRHILAHIHQGNYDKFNQYTDIFLQETNITGQSQQRFAPQNEIQDNDCLGYDQDQQDEDLQRHLYNLSDHLNAGDQNLNSFWSFQHSMDAYKDVWMAAWIAAWIDASNLSDIYQ